MKGVYSAVIVIGVLVAGGLSFPDQRPARFGYDFRDVANGPHEERRSLYEDAEDNGPEQDTEANFNPFAYAPLASFVQSMQAMMKKVQMQMGEVLSRMPPQEIDWGKLGNTTSHTQVVDSHRITVNETSYSNKELSSAGAVLHIRVVDVKPEDSSDSQATLSPHIGTEGSNEIPEKREQTEERLGSFIYLTPDSSTRVERGQSDEYDNFQPDSLNEVDNSFEVFKPIHEYDLSGDTRVNYVRDQAKKGGLIMIDPDAELIDVIDGKVRNTYYPHESNYYQQRTQPIFP